MARSKHVKKPSKQSTPKKSLEPVTEVDYLEAADEQEKGGDKWKAGDAVKATRFFARALDLYNAGLEKYPASFDLAYNKAHLTYVIAEDPRIGPNLGDRIEVLQGALEAHRHALRLNEDNPDVLYNTAQVLTSLAEESDNLSEAPQKDYVVSLLQEATELFGSCLGRQEMLLYEFQATLESSGTSSSVEQSPIANSASESQATSSSSQWATVEEPVTSSIILDTAIAMLSCLEGLLAASAPAESSALASISEIAAPLIHTKIPAFVSLVPETALEEAQETIHLPTLSITSSTSATFSPGARSNLPRNPRFEAKMEAGLAIASFQVSLAEAEYRSGLSSLESFSSRIQDTYEPIMAERKLSAKGLSANEVTPQDVEACVAYSEAYNSTLGPAEADIEGPITNLRAETMLKAMLRTDELLVWTLNIFDSSRETLPLSKRAQIQCLQGDMALRTHRVMTECNAQGNGAAQYIFQADKYYQSAAEKAKEAIRAGEPPELKYTAEEVYTEAAFKSLLSATALTMEMQGFRSKAEMLVGMQRASELLEEIIRDGIMDRSLAHKFWHNS